LLTLANSASALEMYPCQELNQSKIKGAIPLNKVYNSVGRNPCRKAATMLFELKNLATEGKTFSRYAGSRNPLNAPIGMAHNSETRPLRRVILHPRTRRCRRVVYVFGQTMSLGAGAK
jgi:hypothetical protein